jgi:pimeloyl-ACP methyl ester carboxylesterase
MAVIDDVLALGDTLERSYPVVVRGRLKFRVGQLVYVDFSLDESVMGFAFPKEARAALVESEPHKFQLPSAAEMRFNWVHANLSALEPNEARELVVDAWRMVVPKKVSRAYDLAHPQGEFVAVSCSSVRVNGVDIGVEKFGREGDPLVLLVGGPTMLSWPDGLCQRLASAGRHVVRYDLRDSGASTTLDPERPAYDLRDLAADAAALVEALGRGTAHVGGIGVGGMVAQVAALDHPRRFSALTLVGTRPVAPGPVDEDLPDHDPVVMQALFTRPRPDWTDRDAVTAFAAESAAALGNDPEEARTRAARVWDRTPSRGSSVHAANQLGTAFARLDCAPRWRERLGELDLPTLVVHGRDDPFFPVGNGDALAADIRGARLLVLDSMGTALRQADAATVAAAMLAL